MNARAKAIPCLVAALMAVAPISQAEAYGGWHHHGNGPVIGLFALGAAAIAGTAMILTAPVRAVAEAPYYQPGYPQQPAYYPQQAQYYPQQAYAPQAYYAPPPAYYAPAPAYYYGR